ncbi:MAG TPA: Asp-tRNA(Asn)/Glu-tRNA(Gln) amidotransferase subunit GatC [Thermoanaerobaculia bacterium]|nr:Asp-tRNA(Asn)/Glu-tRNA(Gln) amidotransferase subunit GatC [Thermoanaerobaculia bacterium]
MIAGCAATSSRLLVKASGERLNFYSKIMALTREEVRRIAVLARLRFSPEEEDRLTDQLARIVGYIDQLQAFSEIEQEGAGSSEAAAEAADAVAPGLPRASFLDNAPAARDGFLLVPAVKTAEAEGP